MAPCSEPNICHAAHISMAITPEARPGMRIGLLGGSFDPPHGGHVRISLLALRRLRLHQVWWLVSPGNPLKKNGPWPLDQRLAQCETLTRAHPRIRPCAPEAYLGTSYSIDMLKWLLRRHRGAHFVWLMGADNLAGFHHWKDWRLVASLAPMAIMDRFPLRHAALASRAAHQLAGYRVRERNAGNLALRQPPAWAFLSLPLGDESSTAIRNRQKRIRSGS